MSLIHALGILTGLVEETDQSRLEAGLELVILVMHADRRIALEEQDVFKTQLSQSHWRGVKTLTQFFGEATAKVRQVVGDETTEDVFIDERMRILADTPLLAKLQVAVGTMAGSDGEIDDREQRIHARIRQID